MPPDADPGIFKRGFLVCPQRSSATTFDSATPSAEEYEDEEEEDEEEDDITPVGTASSDLTASCEIFSPTLLDTDILAEAAELFRGSMRSLPSTIRIMDLTCIGAILDRVPTITLARDEWDAALRAISSTTNGTRGSLFITGQPGIGEPLFHSLCFNRLNVACVEGKTCFLYYSIIMRLIRGEPTIFQDVYGEVFVSRNVAQVFEKGRMSEALAFVDADNDIRQPDKQLIELRAKIVVVSSLRYRTDRRWMKQYSVQTYLMNLWNWKEYFLIAFVYLPHLAAPIDPSR